MVLDQLEDLVHLLREVLLLRLEVRRVEEVGLLAEARTEDEVETGVFRLEAHEALVETENDVLRGEVLEAGNLLRLRSRRTRKRELQPDESDVVLREKLGRHRIGG